MKKRLFVMLLASLLILAGCGQQPLLQRAVPAADAATETVLAATEAAAVTVADETVDESPAAVPLVETTVDAAEVQLLAQETATIAEEPVPTASEPFSLTMSVPKSVTVSAAEPTVYIPCTVTRTGDGPENGRFQVYQNGSVVWDVQISLQTNTGNVKLTYEFSRYMTQTSDTVVYVLTYGNQTLVAQTAVTLVNYSEEEYIKASGDSLPYYVEVVKNHNVVLVYAKDDNGNYTQLVKTFLCSTGASTPLGNFKAGEHYTGFRTLFANAQRTAYCYGQYAFVISGNYLFHSVPYYTPNKNDLEYDEFNKLGTEASLGCIRLAVQDAKWLYDNCAVGTPISIVNRTELGVERPANIILDTTSPYRNWDPTDPDPANPWLTSGSITTTTTATAATTKTSVSTELMTVQSPVVEELPPE